MLTKSRLMTHSNNFKTFVIKTTSKMEGKCGKCQKSYADKLAPTKIKLS